MLSRITSVLLILTMFVCFIGQMGMSPYCTVLGQTSGGAEDSTSLTGTADAKASADEAKATKEAGKAEKKTKALGKVFKEAGAVEKKLKGFIHSVANNHRTKAAKNERVYEQSSVRHNQHKKYAADNKDENGWTLHHALDTTATAIYVHKDSLNPGVAVFGWHPYWMGSAYKSYNYSLLSHVSYFSYEVDPSNGTAKSIHNWMTTDLFDYAGKTGCKVLLSVTNFGATNNKTLLNNVNVQNALIRDLVKTLDARKADGAAGITIDFEGVPKGYEQKFTEFIIDLHNGLKGADQDYILTLALPALDGNDVFDVKKLNGYVDMFVIMGYDFYTSASTVAGPVSPLHRGEQWWSDLSTSVNNYLNAGADRSKLLLGLPYYGRAWKTASLKVPSDSKGFIKTLMYRSIDSTYRKLAQYDSVAATGYYAFRASNSQNNQYWFDDAKSLGAKYDWVIKNKLGGVGIWALGFDNGTTELWGVLEQKFGGDMAHAAALGDPDSAAAVAADTATLLSTVIAKIQEILPIIQSTASFEQIAGALGSVIILFVCILLLVALLDKDLRALINSSFMSRFAYVALLMTLILLFLRGMKIITPDQFWVLLVLSAGLFVAKLVIDLIFKKRALP